MTSQSGRHYLSLDGLRAVAVLLVFGFHLDLPGLSPGFLGVDVFFILSGFIVTKVTLRRLRTKSRELPPKNRREVEDEIVFRAESSDEKLLENDAEESVEFENPGRKLYFDWSDFFLRRAKRLWPELYLVMGASLLVGAWTLYPSELRRIPVSGLTQAAFFSNLRFWKESSDYFDVDAKSKPLLHMWSLSVEEQFYIVFAIALLGWNGSSQKNSRLINFILILVWGSSLGLYVFLPAELNSFVFYGLVTRAWQFLCGVILARSNPISDYIENNLRKELCEVFSINAAVLFMVGLYLEPSLSRMPIRVSTILPLFSVAILILLLYATEENEKDTMVGLSLSLRPVVFLGQISYSIYLWHWPIICFANIIFKGISSPPVLFGIVILTISLAAFSHHFVTDPIRRISNSRFTQSRASLFLALSPVISFILLCAGILVYVRSNELVVDAFGSHNTRTGAEIQRLGGMGRWSPHTKACGGSRCDGEIVKCGENITSSDVMLVGDSYAAMLGGLLTRVAHNHCTCVHLYGLPTCPPFLHDEPPVDIKSQNDQFGYECRDHIKNIREVIQARKTRFKAIYFFAYWEFFMCRLINNQAVDLDYKVKKILYDRANGEHRTRFHNVIKQLISTIEDHTEEIVFVSGIPFYESVTGFPPFCETEKCLRLHQFPREDADTSLSTQWLREVVTNYTSTAINDKLATKVKLVEPAKYFCTATWCSPYFNSTLAYADRQHLNLYGASLLYPLISSIF